jgi:hypothetical protein
VSYDAAQRTTRELLADWAAVMRELREREVVRTNNNPVGDIAELVVAAHYEGERGSFSQAGWDVKGPDGERIQVKAMRRTPTNNRTVLSPIRDSDYDSVVVVIFNEDFQVTEGLRLSRELVEDLFPVKSYQNGRIISVTQKLRANPEVETVDFSNAPEWLSPVVS